MIKAILRQTPIYWAVRYLRVKRMHAKWTSHDQKMFDFYSQFISPGSLVFDIGANIGNRVKIFLRLGANVVAVEPLEECVRILHEVYKKNPRLTIVNKACGESVGKSKIWISNIDVLSSMSEEWIRAVKNSKRFGKYVNWRRQRIVEVITLDALIEEYGVPVFIKIDVEGYEYEVLRGLSRSVKALSFEFTPERIETSFKCIKYLQTLGEIYLNFSVGESMEFALEEWVTPSEMVNFLSNLKSDRLFGDVYVRFQGHPFSTAF